MSTLLELFKESSALYGGNASYIEYLYEQYLGNPESDVDCWRQRFDLHCGSNRGHTS